MAEPFKTGQMVVTPEGKLGLYHTYGSDDSWARVHIPILYPSHQLRFATEEEIRAAGLSGVGRTPSPLDRATDDAP